MNIQFVSFILLAFTMGLGQLTADLTPQKALEWLIRGNDRYVSDKLEHPERTSERREASAAKQKPFATILGCSDSRVSPEIVFDQGVGDLFVVRVAGNVVSPVELDSIDYSALYLGSSLVLVLGHENCGAVEAVLSKNVKDIEAVAALIEPAVSLYRNKPNGLEDAIKANVKAIVKQLKQAPVLADLIKKNKIDVVGGYYHLREGKVELLK
jgi:carbonic anhydrase